MAFDLRSIRSGKEVRPPRFVVYGTHGIGKSTFAASAPAPVFIQTEDGLGTIDTSAFPLATDISQVYEAIGTLLSEPHEFQTVVLDSLDWLENLIVRKIESTHDAKDLAYGRAAVLAAEEWRQVLAGFNALRNDRSMAVIFLSHCQIKRFDSPEVEPFDRYMLKLQDRSSALVQEWADAVLFANFKTFVQKADVGFNKTVSRGVTTGERVLYCTESPSRLAKNRFGLPDELPLAWGALQAAIAQSAAPTAAQAA